MNVFATLAIFSVESPSTFEAMSQLERLRLYGGLIGGPRMVMDKMIIALVHALFFTETTIPYLWFCSPELSRVPTV